MFNLYSLNRGTFQYLYLNRHWDSPRMGMERTAFPFVPRTFSSQSVVCSDGGGSTGDWNGILSGS